MVDEIVGILTALLNIKDIEIEWDTDYYDLIIEMIYEALKESFPDRETLKHFPDDQREGLLSFVAAKLVYLDHRKRNGVSRLIRPQL